MSRLWFGAAASIAVVICAAPAAAQESFSYCARLSADDHLSSDGVRLRNVGAIIRQDRANYHAFDLGDREDDDDPIFHDRVSRAALQERINTSRVSSAARSAIVNGRPYVCVRIRGDTASVSIEG